jgi:tellurite resistance protein
MASSDAVESQLRERIAARSKNDDAVQKAKESVLELNKEEKDGRKDDKEKKTFGRTPEGIGRLKSSKHRRILTRSN